MLLCLWNSPGKNIGVGSHSLLQGIFPTQGSSPGIQHCRQILCHLNHQGSGTITIHMGSFVPWEVRFRMTWLPRRDLTVEPSQSAVPELAVSGSPGSLVEKQNLSPVLSQLNVNLQCNQSPGWSVNTLKFEKLWPWYQQLQTNCRF